MELLLNALWLLTAAGAITFWYYGSGRARTTSLQKQTLFGQFVLLGCALILLFPVISVTDDLHAQQAVMEDSSRIASRARRAMQGGPGVDHAPALVSPGSAFPDLHRVIAGQASLPEVRVRRFLLLHPILGRSPPLPAN